MKKKYLFIALGLWAIGSVIIMLKMAQGDIEAKVKQWLAIYSCTAEEVNYSLWSKDLNIRGVKLFYDKEQTHLEGSIASIAVTGLKNDGFDYEKPDLTQLADEISIDNLNYTFSRNGVKSEVSVCHLDGKQLYLNLATSAQALLQDKSVQTMISLLYRYRIEQLSLNEFCLKTVLPLPSADGSVQHQNSVSTINKINFPNGFGASLDEKQQGLRASVLLDGIGVKAGDELNISIGRSEIIDAHIPSLQKVLDFQASDVTISRLQKVSDDEIIKIMQKTAAMWEHNLFFSKLAMQDISWQQKAYLRGSLSLEEMLITLDEGARTEMGLSLKGLRSDLLDSKLAQKTGLSPEVKAKYLPDGLVFDTDMAISLSALLPETAAVMEETPDSMKFKIGIRKVGMLSSLLELDIPDTDISSFLLSEELLTQSRLLGFSVDYQDQGLIPLIFEEACGGNKDEVQQLKLELLKEGRKLQASGVAGAEKAVAVMLECPGKLSIAATPEQPVALDKPELIPVFPLGWEVMMTAVSGSKTLEELIQ